MPSQLIYTKSRAGHGSVFARLCQTVKPRYTVVGKTRMGPALEGNLIKLARRGMADEDLNPGPQFFYLTDFSGGSTNHIFGSVRWAKQGGVMTADYICHLLVLREDEIGELWRKGSRLSPAGILFLLEATHFWATEWRGPAQWLSNEALPNWMEAEQALQASVQPTWQHYTGHKRFAALLKEPKYREACMLALPVGTPTPDMLRILHEADYLRSDLGWGIPLYTHADSSVIELQNVHVLGIIGSRVHRQATLTGLPVLEVTEHLTTSIDESPANRSDIPPTLSAIPPQQVLSDPPMSKKKSRHSLPTRPRRLQYALACVVLTGISAAACYYVWINKGELGKRVDNMVSQAEELSNTLVSPNRQKESADKPILNAPQLSVDEQQLVDQQISTIQVGEKLPPCILKFFSNHALRISSGDLHIHYLKRSAEDTPRTRNYQLSSDGQFANISPSNEPGTWVLQIMRNEQEEPSDKLFIRVQNGMLHGISDQSGDSPALALPLSFGQSQKASIILMPEYNAVVGGNSTKLVLPKKDLMLRFSPECFRVSPHRLEFVASAVTDTALKNCSGKIHHSYGDISIPDVTSRNIVQLHTPSSSSLDVSPVGKSHVSCINYEVQGSLDYDVKQAVMQAVEKYANEPRGTVSSGKKKTAASVAGLYHAVDEVIHSAANKRTAAIQRYALLFADKKFMEFCEREMDSMPMPSANAFIGSDTHAQVSSKAMKILEGFDFTGIRLYLCEHLSHVARLELTEQVKKLHHNAPFWKLQLTRVYSSEPGELTWIFTGQPEQR